MAKYALICALVGIVVLATILVVLALFTVAEKIEEVIESKRTVAKEIRSIRTDQSEAIKCSDIRPPNEGHCMWAPICSEYKPMSGESQKFDNE